jgi:hypothetical protein
VRANEQHLLAENRGPVHQWRDVLWMYLALDDAAKAASLADDDHAFDPEFGSSWTAALSWIHGLHAMGRVDPTVRADTSSYAVFRSESARTYAAYNPKREPLHVTFTDGATLDVPPGALGHTTRPTK